MSTERVTIPDLPFSKPPQDLSRMHPSASLGVQYNPFDPNFLKNPHAFFDRARNEAPVCYNPVFNMWLVTGYEEVLKVCEDPVLFSSKNKVDPPNDVKPEVLEILANEGYSVVLQLFNSDPPEHDRISALVHQGFTAASLKASLPNIRTLANELVDIFVEDSHVELRAAYANPLPLSVILDYIGVPREDHNQIAIWDDWWARLFTSAYAIEEQMEAVHQVVAYQKYFEALIESRRTVPCDDLTSRLTLARVEGGEPLRNVEMIWQFMGLLAAGHATTTDAMTNLLLIVLGKSELWSQLRSHPDQILNFIEEGLRFVNPVLGLPRITTQPVELGGVTIPAGSQVLVSYCAANRDDLLTPDADRFNPSRAGVSRHLAFGKGIHYCVGARMSRNMMTVAIEVLLDRLPGLRFQQGYEPKHTIHPFLWGLSHLPVEWDVVR
ncbi:MAG TPA: cytochrome P450 [Terriglobales bacterium]|nr:cytochrome P450 [Terriglobales bacterium]